MPFLKFNKPVVNYATSLSSLDMHNTQATVSLKTPRVLQLYDTGRTKVKSDIKQPMGQCVIVFAVNICFSNTYAISH